MAKNIRSLRRGAKPVLCRVGPQDPNSPRNMRRANKEPSLLQEKKVVVYAAQVDALLGRPFTGRARRKALRKLRQNKK